MPSRVIKSFRYDEQSRQLTVTFISGAPYLYKDVPAHIYTGFKNAFSKGMYFSSHIRDKYNFERLPRD